ncbi:MAG TPA: rhamnulokinase [Verrucomicrobiota bacterium]|nr:rhamnulokinase [Verrucomicrobiota bacterium]HQL77362.1 rhamnulokinase [Verrucomicrobiota bacterium]
MPRIYLAIDLGAESGRVVAGLWNGKTIRLEEIHRFPNGPVYLGDSLRWDVVRLWAEIQNGLSLAARKYGKGIVSVGADTWGVDYVLLNRSDEMLGQPFAYRDARTNGMMEKAFRKVSRAKIFAQTGLQFMQFNTLYQLLAHQQACPGVLEKADALLLMPDFIHWALCGSRVVEFTNGTTTQCMHPLSRNWATGLLKRFGLPTGIFPKVVPPGTRLGVLRPGLAERTGLSKVNVVAPPTHDTASAVAGVPTANTGKANWAYLSSGTWSLMGVEVKQASLGARTQELNLTNEGGLDGTYRLLKNIMGLWLVQQCKRAFDARGRKYEYGELARLAAKAPALRSIVNPDDARFLNPPDMPKAIQAFCRETKQPVPRTEGELVRCAYESLALKYREVLGWLEELTGTGIEVIHIVGGGSQSRILNQFTADACQRPVVTGPVEATAMGNLLVQVRASGELSSLAEMRQVIRRSSDVAVFKPGKAAAWEDASGRFAKLRRGN